MQAACDSCQAAAVMYRHHHGWVTEWCLVTCAGVPGVLAALVLAFLSNLFGSITHYGSGQVRPVRRSTWHQQHARC
jgi:hypothetical protein